MNDRLIVRGGYKIRCRLDMCYLEPSIVFKAKVARHVRISILT
jgi:hypothetical protein